MNKDINQETEKLRYLILALQRQGNRMLNDQLSHLELTSSKAEVLRVLESYEPLSVKEIGNLLVCETGSPSRLIKNMVQDNLVESIINPSDSRAKLLKMTQKGNCKVKEVKNIENQLYLNFLEILSEEEITQTNLVLSKLLKNISTSDRLEKRNLI